MRKALSGLETLGDRQALQRESLEAAREGRAPVRSREATIRIQESSLPGHREEPVAAVHPICNEQSIHGQTIVSHKLVQTAPPTERPEQAVQPLRILPGKFDPPRVTNLFHHLMRPYSTVDERALHD